MALRMRKYRSLPCLLCLLVTTIECGFAQDPTDWLGTWKLDLERSKQDFVALGPGVTVVSQTIKFELVDRKMKMTGNTNLSDGRTSNEEALLLSLDGSGTTVSSGRISFRRMSDTSFDITVQINTNGMNATGLNHFVISLDGKILTETKTQILREPVSEGVEPTKGKVLKSSTSVLVFNRVS
jgi:hypothetical protein